MPLATQKVNCPHCDQSFAGPHRLATHIQHRHTSPSAGAPLPPNGQAGSGLGAPQGVPAEVPASVDQHLKTALDELNRRQQNIEEQLSRMEALRSEKEAIGRQIAAVSAALQAFLS